MAASPYDGVGDEKLILRDHLAVDRTALSNERTFLSYIRTSLTLVVAGISFTKFFDALWIEIVGWSFIAAAIPLMAFGIYRYMKMRRLMHSIGKQSEKEREEADSIPLGRQHYHI
ncbi:DUF202 domain-containing protein [Candidatus Poribacteria bacterium]|jgi:putative membrane protein|nr:DUF202 domain-containing protein [Candidatus Poribacteria bacterium]MBT5534501.1 DUF202 domain-containing protein [Candidatus Poribacteria bacterium]MBT5712045.1 DUF202 domain-containing protein [Candidatus Poribacteria bacterium]MBT7097156.1 DUF202 domain-containing protein [Candidatus Poribacteria bacterium]MBT7804010.1 DUF202 domain-containing protein [Candidatus Poribacteria bacterium]